MTLASQQKIPIVTKIQLHWKGYLNQSAVTRQAFNLCSDRLLQGKAKTIRYLMKIPQNPIEPMEPISATSLYS